LISGRIACVHFVGHRQSVGRLHQRQHHLAAYAAVLGHPVLSSVGLDLGLTMHGDRGQVVEHHREVLIDQRTHQHRQAIGDTGAVIFQHIHRTQQMLMIGRAVGKAKVTRQRHGVHPPQDAELGRWVAKPVEHHQPQAGQHVDLAAGGAPGLRKVFHTQRVP